MAQFDVQLYSDYCNYVEAKQMLLSNSKAPQKQRISNIKTFKMQLHKRTCQKICREIVKAKVKLNSNNIFSLQHIVDCRALFL